MKILAYGLILSKKAYFKDLFNLIDFSIVILSWFYFFNVI